MTTHHPLQLYIGGCRGSRSVTDDPKRAEFGAGTSAYALIFGDPKNGGRIINQDFGTGAHRLEQMLRANFGGSPAMQQRMVLFSHFHHDHYDASALTQWGVMFDPAVAKTFLGAMSAPAQRALLQMAASHPGGPDLQSHYRNLHFGEIVPGDSILGVSNDQGLGIGSINTIPLPHPGGAVGYRYDAGETEMHLSDRLGESSVVVLIDLAMQYAGEITLIPAQLVEFARDASVLVVDAPYLDAELASGSPKKHFGHFTMEQALRLALLANVDHLVITHHDPDANDEELHRRQAYIQSVERDFGLTISFAKPGAMIAAVPTLEQSATKRTTRAVTVDVQRAGHDILLAQALEKIRPEFERAQQLLDGSLGGVVQKNLPLLELVAGWAAADGIKISRHPYQHEGKRFMAPVLGDLQQYMAIRDEDPMHGEQHRLSDSIAAEACIRSRRDLGRAA
jgi:phosphoribosyl 1,2-cyclic phosphodiesterase